MDNNTISNKKKLGAFYTPSNLADYLAKTIFSFAKFTKSKTYVALDPASGDGRLLLSLYHFFTKQNVDVFLAGIDIDASAVQNAQNTFNHASIRNLVLCTDALYPFNSSTPKIGWNVILDNYLPQGIDIIISNPPWGAYKEQYTHLRNDFQTAIGQFDIYDLFIETSINCLNNNGCFAFIVPDSIYTQEHKHIRKFLLNHTTIKKIVRLGEGFFENVNISATLLFGIKRMSKSYKIECSHLSTDVRKKVLRNELDLFHAVNDCEHSVPVKAMLSADYDFLIDVESNDEKIVKLLSKLPKIGMFAKSHRGIELSKKGNVVCCDNCHKWFPTPKINHIDYVCPHCGTVIKDSHSECIITPNYTNPKDMAIIVGENIYRYITKSKSYIKTGYEGINYKNLLLYKGSKILVRKTGVGITAGIDYDNCATNQVVYILKRLDGIDTHITNEVILSILNSRIITYYIIKTKGSNGWQTHPYISQTEICSLPFPLLDFRDQMVITYLNEITNLVKKYAKGEGYNIPNDVDAEIEKRVALLYGFGMNEYSVIYDTIKGVQQMIPFKRLLNINIDNIFKNGI